MFESSVQDQNLMKSWEKAGAIEDRDLEFDIVQERKVDPTPYDFTNNHYEPYQPDYSKFPECKNSINVFSLQEIRKELREVSRI